MNSQPFRVLVAEIEPEPRSQLSELFSTWEYDVQKATDGIGTVLIAQAWEPHVIVAAYRLGNMLITEVADRLERSRCERWSRSFGLAADIPLIWPSSSMPMNIVPSPELVNNISNDVGRVKVLGVVFFMISNTLFTSAHTHWFPSRE
jgi:CheY-like chemotaxis protein